MAQKITWLLGAVAIFAGLGLTLLAWQTNYIPAEPRNTNINPITENKSRESSEQIETETDFSKDNSSSESEDITDDNTFLPDTDVDSNLEDEEIELSQDAPEAEAPEGDSDNNPNTQGSRPTSIRISSINLDSSVNPVDLDNEGYIDPPRNTVGWYTGSYKPNERGPTVIAAHVSWARYGPDKFARLSEMTPGEEIEITDENGYIFTYKVANVYQINKASEAADFFKYVVYDSESEHALWLVTCGGALSGGSFQDNIFVRAELVNVHT